MSPAWRSTAFPSLNTQYSIHNQEKKGKLATAYHKIEVTKCWRETIGRAIYVNYCTYPKRTSIHDPLYPTVNK